ncbi:exported hypothetical protein [Frankia sp. AiPs1]|nr:endonuclease/exonuclease/phosphatase family protein [Frankia sp. AiPa1]MCL9758853.1 endonuclease/exonuclease/phosphatase family protein [Frankia sp. AiPa1]
MSTPTLFRRRQARRSPYRVLLALAVAAPVAFGLAATPAAHAATGSSGSFAVLSYNIAGLPELLSSAPSPRQQSTTAIGQRIGPYSIVNVQEDFNYHAALYAADNHPYRTPTSGGAGIGSGLNTLSSFPYDTASFQRVKWNTCSLSGGDCLTPKGFTFARVTLAPGVTVDVYNLHTDAGTSRDDETARAANLNQVGAYIAAHSAGQPVIVFGDTNSRYTRAGDTIGSFAAAGGLTDAWVQLVRGGSAPAPGSDALLCDENAITNTCEVVDKVLYRGSAQVTLTATSYANKHADFLNSSGVMLSDHDPIAVGLTWRTTGS